MSKDKEFKHLWSFDIENLVEEESRVEEKDEATGEVKTVIKREKINKPDKLLFKRPGRKDVEDAQEEYAVELSRCVKKGIITKAMLAKRYRSEGGPLTDDEKKEIGQLYTQFEEKQGDLIRLRTIEKKKGNTKERELVEEIAALRKSILDFESSYQVLFQNTADSKAEIKAIIWYLLNLTYYKKYDDSTPTKMFPQPTIDEQTEAYYAILDSDNPKKAQLSMGLSRALSVASLLYYGGSIDSEDYAQLDKDLDEQAKTEVA
jgi:hypothetical protein